MAKRKVKFECGDAPQPRVGPDGLIHIPAALNYTFQPDSTTTVNTRIRADRALLLVGTGYLRVDKPTVVPPGEEIVFEGKNLSTDQLHLGARETLVRAYVLDSSDVEIAG